MSFGRKGLAPGQNVPSVREGAARGASLARDARSAISDDSDDLARKREAFIAAERSRSAAIAPDGPAPADCASPADLRNAPRPAKPLPGERVGQSGFAAVRRTEVPATKRSSAARGYVFGNPASRNVGLAYLLWFVCGQFSVHRFYCGQKDSAIIQMSLWIGSLVTLFIIPPIGLVGFAVWLIWIFIDLFRIPGMLREFKAKHDHAATFD
ncbi:TM2 domain-containing protein [Erythrobacter sp.]|uniref:TM2 domain-containing protein n=1 Tax=Erythrobacter sp. TaxID=1042 RepID=UPI003C751C59